nr:hypothetical protein [Rickettsia sibirica]
MAEFYGKERANFCVKLAIIFNIIVVLIISLMDKLEATNIFFSINFCLLYSSTC